MNWVGEGAKGFFVRGPYPLPQSLKMKEIGITTVFRKLTQFRTGNRK